MKLRVMSQSEVITITEEELQQIVDDFETLLNSRVRGHKDQINYIRFHDICANVIALKDFISKEGSL